MTGRDLSCSEESLAHLSCIKDPFALLLDFSKPLVVVETRRRPIDLLKPLVFTNDNQIVLFKQLFNLCLSVDISCGAGIFSKIKDITSGKFANRLENWLEVLVSGGDLRVSLEATVLQEAVERLRFVHGLASTVDNGENFQDLGADLTSIMSKLLILEVL